MNIAIEIVINVALQQDGRVFRFYVLSNAVRVESCALPHEIIECYSDTIIVLKLGGQDLESGSSECCEWWSCIRVTM